MWSVFEHTVNLCCVERVVQVWSVSIQEELWIEISNACAYHKAMYISCGLIL